MVDLLKDATLFQLGTTGEFDKRKFNVIGRQKMSWDQGFWNEWYLRFDDGQAGWIAEAQGTYAVALEVAGTIPALKTLRPDREVALNGQVFTVQDIKEADVAFVEGYTPPAAFASSAAKITSVDLVGENEAFATIDCTNGKMYIGRYVDFDELKLENLRTPSSVASTFKFALACTVCKTAIDLRAGDRSVVAVCPKCAALQDVSGEQASVVNRMKKRDLSKLIPIGQKGKLKGVEWEVIGYLERADGAYVWSEYLLYHQTKGFRWLTEFNGHWNFVTMVKRAPVIGSSESMLSGTRSVAAFDGKNFELFNRGKAVTKYALGEFYWQLRIDDKVSMEDYISPPFVLTAERSSGETVWSLGEKISSREVKKAFGLDYLPREVGVASNDTSFFTRGAEPTKLYWGAFTGFIILIQIAMLFVARNDHVYSGNFTASTTTHTFVSPPFELKGGTKNVEVTVTAPVQNNWLEIQGELVNDANGEDYEFEQGVEFYSGYDSDGSWTEGSRTSSTDLSSIPAGTYHLNVDASGPAMASPIDIGLAVSRDVVTWSNFFWALTLLSILPLIVWWRSRSFEVQRWSQSDFSPFNHGGFE